MREVFADAGYWIAMLSLRDELHMKAAAVTEGLGAIRLVTTRMVLVEVLNFMAGAASTGGGSRRGWSIDDDVEIIAQTDMQFGAALDARGRTSHGASQTARASWSWSNGTSPRRLRTTGTSSRQASPLCSGRAGSDPHPLPPLVGRRKQFGGERRFGNRAAMHSAAGGVTWLTASMMRRVLLTATGGVHSLDARPAPRARPTARAHGAEADTMSERQLLLLAAAAVHQSDRGSMVMR